MPKRTVLSEKSVNVEADAFGALMDGGFIDIYGGDAPSSPDAPVGEQVRAVSLAFGMPAFGRAAAGSIIANGIQPATAERTVNPVTWARIYRSDHKTAVMDVSVGTRDATLILPTVNIAANVTISCSFFSHAIKKTATE